MRAHSERTRAEQLYHLGRYDDATRGFTDYLVREPDDAHAVSMLALCQVATGNKTRAQDTAELAVAMAPHFGYAHYVLGIVRSQCGKPAQARAALDSALALDPEDADYLAALASVLGQEGNWRSALFVAEDALKHDPSNEQAIIVRSDALAVAGRCEDAEDSALHALRNNPESVDAHSSKGYLLMRRGDHKAAARCFCDGLRLSPHDAWAADGMREALRASFPLYRWYLLFLSLLDRYGTGGRIAVFLVAGLTPVTLFDLVDDHEWFLPWAVGLSAPFLVLLFVSWFGATIMDTLMLAHPLGRYLFDKEEWLESALFGTLFLLIISGALIESFDTIRGFGVGMPAFFGLIFVTFARKLHSSLVLRRFVIWVLGLILLIFSLAFLLLPSVMI